LSIFIEAYEKFVLYINDFRFPTNEKYKKLWLDVCKKTKISKQAKVCSRHFNISCFKTWDGNGRRTLKKNAVPVLFLDKKNKYLER